MAITWEPRDYQYTSAKFLVGHACAALYHDPGLGKTSATLAAFSHLKKKGVARKALVLAPLRVAQITWPGEIAKWKNFSHLTYQVLHGHRKDRIDKSVDMYFVNFEGFAWLLDTEAIVTFDDKGVKHTKYIVHPWRLKELGVDTVVIDELTKFKRTSSRGFKIMKQIHRQFARRWGLTGSPAANHLMDLFGQCYVLDCGRSLGKYITHYRYKYFDKSPENEYTWTIKPGAEAQIYERIAPLVLRLSDKDYVKMPKLVETQIEVRLEPKAALAYKEMWERLIAEIRSGVVLATNAADKINKCRQILGGALYHDIAPGTDGHAEAMAAAAAGKPKGPRKWDVVSRAKLDALGELVDELAGRPLLVGYEYKHEGERIAKAIKGAVVVSDLTDKEFKEAEGAWNRGEIPVLAAHPATIGHGLNLQGCCQHVCWYASTWNGELDDQFVRRVRRFGNKHDTVFVYRLVVPGTVDGVIIKALEAKDATQQALFRGLVELAQKAGFVVEEGRL